MKYWKILWSLALALAFLSPCQGGQAGPTVSIKSPEAKAAQGSYSYRFPPFGGQLTFQIGDPPASNNPNARRIRYMLQGRDTGWNEPPGEMNLVVRFYDRNNNQVSQTVFLSQGTSSGWKGTPDNSMFAHRQELVVVPAGADNFRIVLASAGPASSVGALVIDDLIVSRIGSDGSPAQRLLELPNPLSETPADWDRTGSHPDMAKVLRLERPGLSKEVLAIIDDDPIAHAEWQLGARAATKVHAGEKLSLEWNEMFCVGSANMLTVGFKGLSPGQYRFLANELDVFGNPTSKETALEINVPVPYWKTPSFLILALVTASLLAAGATRAIIRVNTRRQMEALQQERAVEQERLRIARDIHDDLGARLTHISLISGMAENNADTENDRAKFTEISGMARELVFAMYETVWSVNPQNDHLESLVSFLCQSTENLCKPANIRCRIRVSLVPGEKNVRSEIRHNIILAVKETVHNAIKHSQASEIELQISFSEPELQIRVSDNGGGFDSAGNPSGNGLRNIHRRMESIGGKAVVESTANGGTRIHFAIPIP